MKLSELLKTMGYAVNAYGDPEVFEMPELGEYRPITGTYITPFDKGKVSVSFKSVLIPDKDSKQ